MIAVGALVAVALALAVSSISTVLMSISLAVFLALGMAPAVSSISRRGVSHAWSVVMVAGAFLLLVAAILAFVVPATLRQFSQAVQSAPDAVAALTSTAWFTGMEETFDLDGRTMLMQAMDSVATPESILAISGGVLRAGFGAVGVVSSTFIVVVLTLYFVSSLEAIKRSAASLVPAYRREGFSLLLEKITTSVGRVVAGGVTLSSINAAVVFVIQLLIGSSLPALMAIIAFFITLVPMIGSMVFLFVGAAGALFISPSAALIFAIAYFAYIQIEAYVVTPRIMGRAVNVPAVLVIIGAMIGAALLGLLGALLAIPVTASILIVIREVVIPRANAQVTAPSTL
ncbi:AI-2E family transporter [Cellulosimicrobium funkei]|nr:AI-2E family transporter [Cellulosimicrobium funkei]